MTFEIKGLVDYRLDRVDTPGEGTSRGTPPTTRLRIFFLPADVLPMVRWWIHGACLACLSSWWPARKTVASRPSQKPGLSSRPGQTTSFTRASPTITQPPQWKQIGNARRQTMGCARPRPVLPGRVCETSSTSGVRSTRRLRVAASRNA